MIRVRAPSRLHFGLLSPGGGEGPWPNREGEAVLPRRQFGGVGLMVREPGVEVSAIPAEEWSAEGPLAGRALATARRIAGCVHAAGRPLRLRVEAAAPGHVGLGTGTQLGLAVARALTAAWGVEATAEELARWSGRGLRSALGVHGFERGGLLVEAGKRSAEGLAPLAARVEFPSEWRLLLAIPPDTGVAGLHGREEREAFAHLAEEPNALARTDALCRLALLGILPAVAERDLSAFGEALYDFNRRAGEAFAAVQGGIYSGPEVAELVAFLRKHGVRGVGQSSWGPAVFAVLGDAEQAADLAGRVRTYFGLEPSRVWVTEACNRGAAVYP
jgi:beta-RFAP synthase